MTPGVQSFIDTHNEFIAHTALRAQAKGNAVFAATGAEAARAIRFIGQEPKAGVAETPCFCSSVPHHVLELLIRGAGVNCIPNLRGMLSNTEALAAANGKTVLVLVITTAAGLEASVLVIDPSLSAGDA